MAEQRRIGGFLLILYTFALYVRRAYKFKYSHGPLNASVDSARKKMLAIANP